MQKKDKYLLIELIFGGFCIFIQFLLLFSMRKTLKSKKIFQDWQFTKVFYNGIKFTYYYLPMIVYLNDYRKQFAFVLMVLALNVSIINDF